jgi:hypothetical protein
MKRTIAAVAAVVTGLSAAHAATINGTISAEGNLDNFPRTASQLCTFTGSDVDTMAGAGENYDLTGTCTSSVQQNGTVTTSVDINVSTTAANPLLATLTISGQGNAPLVVVNGNGVLSTSTDLGGLAGPAPIGLVDILAAFDGQELVASIISDNPNFNGQTATLTFAVDSEVPLPGAAVLLLGGLGALGAGRCLKG